MDATPGFEGLTLRGQPGTAQYLSCEKWYSPELAVVEHIACREQPAAINFPHHFDQDIYPGNRSIVDKIGNLTLLSIKANSSIYSEWPDKVFYYWTLTKPQSTVLGPTAEALKTTLGVTTIPPSLLTIQASTGYLAHLAPIAHLGIQGLTWDKQFISRRSKHSVELIFDRLDSWLR